jgi:CsoR family transcriptional regulator, copper-sensing transcriptional repressor
MTTGYAKNKDDLQARLRRIEGQVRGIQRMVDEDRYCIDILTQVNSIKAALDKVALALLGDHVDHCVIEAVREGRGEEKLEELTAAIGRYLGGRP